MKDALLNDPHDAKRYLQFVASLRQAQAATELPGLDLSCERVLEFLGQAWREDKSIKVLQVMQHMPDMSSTTVHRRLKMLVAQDFIKLEMDEQDNRIKHIRPTDKTWALFAKRGQIIMDALTGP